jgi:hypothetical protein
MEIVVWGVVVWFLKSISREVLIEGNRKDNGVSVLRRGNSTK